MEIFVPLIWVWVAPHSRMFVRLLQGLERLLVLNYHNRDNLPNNPISREMVYSSIIDEQESPSEALKWAWINRKMDTRR